MSRTRKVFILALAAALTLDVAAPRPSHAIHPDARAVIVGGLYGIAAGTVVGICTLPFSDNKRTMLIGSSVGLYLGMIVGAYYAGHKDDPGNPLHAGDAVPATRPDLEAAVPEGMKSAGKPPPAPLHASVSVLRF